MSSHRHRQASQRSAKAFETLLNMQGEQAKRNDETSRGTPRSDNPLDVRVAEWRAAGFGVREIHNETDALVAGLTSPAVRYGPARRR